MRRFKSSFAIAVVPCFAAFPARADPTPPTDTTAYHAWYDALREITLDPERGSQVQGITVTYDAGTIHLIDGTLTLFEPIQGRTVGATFVGRGRFTMSAPIPVEREQLRRYLQADSADLEIRTAVFFFTDPVAHLFPDVSWEPKEVPSNARREVEEALEYLSDDDGWMHRDLLIPILNAMPGFFHAHVAESRGDPLLFTVNPYDAEEVSLSQRTERGRARETIAQFHQHADYESGRSIPQEGLDLVRTLHVDVESTIESNMDFSAVATLTVNRINADHQWVPFRLYSELEVDSIRWDDGSPVEFARPKESSDLWINFGGMPADSGSLRFHYHGDLLDRYRNNLWVEVKSTGNWFPLYEYWRPTSHRMTFHVPDDYLLTAVGSKVSETTADDVTTTTWTTPPVRQATFNLGHFEEHLANDPRIPNLRVQIDERAHTTIGNMAADANVFLLEQRDMAEQVTADLANSFAFFKDVFGDTPVDEFTATEIPYAHGEAYPGLVLLSWTTFQWTAEKGFDEMFRAHEVAHQWWGIGVHPATYHDRWLSEGFAEFAGMWYMARVRGSHEMLMDRLEETREAILARRDAAAPIWLGTRAANSAFPADYQTIVYHKGAWVLHMLRTLLTDPNTGSDERFVAMIQDFYYQSFGRPATTEQFKAVVETHAGIEMDWFFNQWVYGSGIPEYRFSYNLEELPGGEYQATVRVRQDKVPDDFRMIVPIFFDFGAAGTAQININVTGPVTEQVLPVLPMRPERIVFNPFESVLAETRTEGWR